MSPMSRSFDSGFSLISSRRAYKQAPDMTGTSVSGPAFKKLDDFPAVEDLLLWRDPRRSGLVLTGITAVYILLEWSHLSLLRIVSHSLLAAVTLSFLWNNIASFTNRCVL